METIEEKKPTNFIRDIIDEDIKNRKYDGRVATRFPPEPNGYLHIGHAKAICLNFGIASSYENATCNLRFDDTNPTTEDEEYIESIKKDIKWLGFDFENRLFYASDYFDKFYEHAVALIKKGKAYVCELKENEIKEFRGTLKTPGKNSIFRERSIEENLILFEKMKNGEFENGFCVLRAKIDMSSPNMNMRDPILYRIKKAEHHRTGDKWCIYPMYDFAHCLEDSIENITHSICTLEFEDHRPLYDWVLDALELTSHPQQIEFARLNLTYTVMSKRKLLELVEENIVSGWDDPRMPTISGMCRRGYTPESIKDFCERIGVAKSNSTVDIALLEHCLREDLNKRAKRVMAVLEPLKVVIENYPENQVEELDAENNPEDPEMGKRKIKFSKVIYIEREDFMENPPKKYFRMSPGKEVRLKHAYYVTCKEVIKNEENEIVELRCVYDPATKGGWSDDGRKIKGTLHWVSEVDCVSAEIRLYDNLFNTPVPDAEKDFKNAINKDSINILRNCKIESLAINFSLEERFQFLRKGYFCLDSDSTKENLVFNRTVSLKDSWGKLLKNKK